MLILSMALGCGSSGTHPAFTIEETKAMEKKEKSGDYAELEKLEKKYGKDHPQVKQMRMEQGLDPFPNMPTKK